MNRPRKELARRTTLGLVVLAFATVAASCSADDGVSRSTEIEGLGSSLVEIQRRARREGELNLVVWPDYAHESWANVFAQQTGCEVATTTARSSSDMIGLLETGRWDGVSASGDASVRLMTAGDVAPVNPDLIPNYEQIQEGVKHQSHNSLDEQPYGIPHGRAPTLLLFRTDAFPDGVESARAIWEGSRRYPGRVSVYDDPLVIADAAVYLKARRPELGIEDPYELDGRQFRAAVALVRQQAPRVGRYWTRDVANDVRSFTTGDIVVGTAWPQQVSLLERKNVPVEAIKAIEGTTGWSDTWMVSSKAKNPNCMYLWMDYIVSPESQAKIAEFFHVAPVNLTACELTKKPDHCTALHAGDEEWWSDVYYWTTPRADCGDGRGEVCMSQEEWEAAWTRIKARR